MAELCGIVGIGQTRYQAARKDVSMVGLVREAAEKALADAELSWKDIDAVVIGKAPDMFEGVMMPELFLNDALGGAYKPMLRVHTAGSVGGSTGIVAASLIQGGVHDRVLTVAFEKQSESNAMWALSIKIPRSRTATTALEPIESSTLTTKRRPSQRPPPIVSVTSATSSASSLLSRKRMSSTRRPGWCITTGSRHGLPP